MRHPKVKHYLYLLLVCIVFAGPLPAQEEAPGETGSFQEFQTVNLDDPSGTFQQIQSRIRDVSYFRASFTEKKELNALSRTIENRGFVLFARERGLFRRVTHPFPTSQLITRDGLVIEKTPDNTRRKQLKPGSAPRQFLNSLYLVFSGNFTKFKDRFRIELKMSDSQDGKASRSKTGKENSGKTWYLRLQPAGEELKSFFSNMIVKGRGKLLLSFRLQKKNGDTTRTTFHDQTYPDGLSEDQVSLFRSMYEN